MSSTDIGSQGFSSGEEYQTLLGSFAQAFWETDANGMVVADSPSWRAYTGQSLEEWLGEGWAKAVHPDDQEYALSQWQQAARLRQPVNAEFRLRSPTGGWRWTNVRATPMLNADGSVRKWLGINIDIQDKKEAEAALEQANQTYQRELEQQIAERTQQLEESRALLKATLDSTLEMIQVFRAVRNQAGEIVDFVWTLNNQSSEQQYGDVIGQSLLTLNPGVKEVGIFDTFKQVCETGVADQSERHYTHEQFEGWFYQSTVKLGDGVATTTTDITVRKQAEAELASMKELLQAILDSTPFIIQAFEAVRDGAGTLVDFTWIMNNQGGVSQNGEVIGQSLLRQNPGVLETGLFEKFVQVTETGLAIEHEQYYSHEQFEGQWFYQTLVKMGDGFVMTTQDITERKKAEAEIHRLKDEIAQQATDKYQLLFNSMDQGFCIIEVLFDEQNQRADYRFIETNQAFLRQTGLENALGKTMRELAPEHEQFWFETYAQVARSGQSVHFEHAAEALGHFYDVYAFRIGEPSQNRVAILFNDILERKQNEKRQEILLKLSDALRAQSNGESIKELVVKTIAEHLGLDRCWISEVFLAEGISTVGPEHIDPNLLPMSGVFQLSEYPETMRQLSIQPMCIEDVAKDARFSDSEKKLLAGLQLGALLVTPLRKGPSQVIWALCAAMTTPRQWTDSERALLEDVADRAWAALVKVEAEEALRKSEKRLRLAIEATELATWEWNLQTNEVYWNEQHFRLFGMEPKANPQSPEEFIRHVHPRDQERVKSLLRQSIAERSVYDAEFCAVREDDSSRWMSGYGRITEELDGQPIRMSGVMFDVDERRRAQEALHRSESRLRAIFKSAKDYAIYTTDLTRHITSWNRGAEVVFGYSEREMMYQPGDQLYTPEDRAQGIPENEAKKAIRAGEAENERWHIRKDGSYFYGSGVVTPLRDEGGKIVGLLKVIRDLTIQKRAEEGLKEADRRKNEFLAMLAHELRNPMATVSNGLQVLSLTTATNAQAKAVLEMMTRQTHHLVRMVDDLLDVSRISQGKIEVKKEHVNLAELVRQATDSVRVLVVEKQQRLTIQITDEPVLLEGDATRLVQVVTNLLINANRYTGPGGDIHLSLARTEDRAILQVRDTGIGLTLDQLTSIFELFVQVDNSLARSGGGLGLGLTLVRQIVELHGGTVEGRSEGLGQGSTFVVCLPTLTEVQSPPQHAEEVAAAPLRLLIVDDNPDAAFTLRMLLELKGYDVHSRISGRAGLKAAEHLRPDVILLDIGMPDMDGYETCRQIRQQPWGKKVFVIAISGYGQKEDQQKAQAAGFNEHLTKPVEVEALIQVLSKLS